ncbi:hypothetical protein HKD37_04G010890 [Glycine soja]
MAQKEKDSKEVFGIGGRFQVKISYFFWEDSPFDQHVFYAAKGWYLPRGDQLPQIGKEEAQKAKTSILLRVWKLLKFKTPWLGERKYREWRRKKEEPSQKAEEVTTDAQNAPKVEVGDRTPVGAMKDLVFNTKIFRNLFNSPLIDTSVKIACGLGPILGEPFTFSIHFPPLPTESIAKEPSRIQKDVPHVHIPTPHVDARPYIEDSSKAT